jgi:hypothetical protein
MESIILDLKEYGTSHYVVKYCHSLFTLLFQAIYNNLKN